MSEPLNIAYIVSHGAVYSHNGYAIRTHGIARALQAHGVNVTCLVRPGRPWDMQQQSEAVAEDVMLDGIRYLHHRWPAASPERDIEFFNACSTVLSGWLQALKVDAVLVASNYQLALPALMVAKKLALPCAYEVRGFWELSKASKQPGFERTDAFQHDVAAEVLACQQADQIFTLNDMMRHELQRRAGLQPLPDSAVVPNGVLALPDEATKSHDLAVELGLEHHYVFGFLGTMNRYEGMDDVFYALAALKQAGVDCRLLLVGAQNPYDQGNYASLDSYDERLFALAKTLEITDLLVFTGLVPHAAIGRYYGLVDTILLPRKDDPVCQIVMPMKGIEALAYGKHLLISDVAALTHLSELVDDVYTFAAGDIHQLTEAMYRAVTLAPGRQRIAYRREQVWQHFRYQQLVMPMVSWLKAAVEAPSSLLEPSSQQAALTLVIAGHNLQFIERFIPGFEAAGFHVLVDTWQGHAEHNEADSLALLAQADVILCEWLLGNACWYAAHKPAHVPLVVRCHAMELNKKYIHQLPLDAVAALVVVSPYMKTRLAQVRPECQALIQLIPNGVDVEALQQPKPARDGKTIGFVGMVPQSKRLDRALDVLAQLRQDDPDYCLRVKGKQPADYVWMEKRGTELRWYQQLEARIADDPLLAGAVQFDPYGDDMADWYSHIDFMLSVSEHESFHYSVVDGAAAGALPLVLAWPGSGELYPPEWLFTSVDALSDAIRQWQQWPAAAQQAMRQRNIAYVSEHFDHKQIGQQLVELLHATRQQKATHAGTRTGAVEAI